MEKSDADAIVDITTSLITGKITDGNDAFLSNHVLPYECGDSLWDKVLEQDETLKAETVAG